MIQSEGMTARPVGIKIILLHIVWAWRITPVDVQSEGILRTWVGQRTGQSSHRVFVDGNHGTQRQTGVNVLYRDSGIACAT